MKSCLGRVESARPEGRRQGGPSSWKGRSERSKSHLEALPCHLDQTQHSLDKGSLETEGRQSFFSKHTQNRAFPHAKTGTGPNQNSEFQKKEVG